jgi:heme exporter protein B
MTTPNWWNEAGAVFVKDVRSELRTRAAVANLLLFGLVTLIVMAFFVKTTGPGLTKAGMDTTVRAYLLSGLLWVILFFSAMAGLPRTFVKEEEMRTAAALRLAARPSAVFTGKLLFNVALVLLVAVLVLPLFLIFFTPQVRHWGLFLGHLAAGSIGMAASTTILGAMVARAGGKAYLMLPLAFPILLPILAFSINGTATALMGKPGNLLVVIVSYLIAMGTLSAMLFDRVWTES